MIAYSAPFRLRFAQFIRMFYAATAPIAYCTFYAGYVASVKSAQVLPMMIIGALVFKEKIVGIQWAGLILILIGLVLLGTN